MKVFTSSQFIDKLYWLTNDVPNVYYSKKGTWATYYNGKFRFDCVTSIKALLWGFYADKNKLHGGAVYGSNGVKDFTCNGALNYCTGVSQDFSKISAGEYLCMKGTKYNHSGIYLGNGKVFECTTGWNTNKCIISDISSTGVRSYKGKKSLKWTYHGKLNYIDYGVEPKPQNVNVYYRVKTQKYGWLPQVKNLEDYAGWKNDPIIGVAIKVDNGDIKYQVHERGRHWLPYVSGYDINNGISGWAGDNRPIDCIRIIYTANGKKAKYKVNSYPWVYNDEPDASGDTYAGVMGTVATKLRITIE